MGESNPLEVGLCGRQLKLFVYGLCLWLSLACLCAATQQRLAILAAHLHASPTGRVPQMLMCLEQRELELPALQVALLPPGLLLPKITTQPTLALDRVSSPSPRDPGVVCWVVRGPPNLA